MASNLVPPKKPVGGAYGVFLEERRPEFSKACEGKGASAISTIAGEAWKKLDDTAKAPYQQKYEAAKAKYEEDMKSFLAAGGEKSKGAMALRAEKRKAKEGKKTKDLNQPKRPAGGGYGVFLAKNREEITKSLPAGHKITDVAKAAGEQWKALSEEAKKPYTAEYVQKQEEWKKAMEDYKAANPEESEESVEEASKEVDTPQKKTKVPKKRGSADASAAPVPAAKRSRGGKRSASEVPAVDAALLEEAESLSLDVALKNLLSRPDVLASGVSHTQMLEALKSSGGLVNKAKSTLLGHLGA